MSGIWKELPREEIERRILSNLNGKWATPKQLEVLTGIPWRVLMRSLLRMQLYGEVEGRLEYIKANRSRIRHRKIYRKPYTGDFKALYKAFGLKG